jgi:hypothetical protein
MTVGAFFFDVTTSSGARQVDHVGGFFDGRGWRLGGSRNGQGRNGQGRRLGAGCGMGRETLGAGLNSSRVGVGQVKLGLLVWVVRSS